MFYVICAKKKTTIAYSDYNRCIKRSGCYLCKKCSYKKAAQTNIEKYGFSSPLQSDFIKEKIKQTNLERYGVENYGQTKECHEKIKQTCLEKYGVEHFSQLQEIKDKKAATNLERYGHEYINQVEEFKTKQQLSLFEHYGVYNPMHSKEIKEKLAILLYKNGTRRMSLQQIYLNNIYGGELNFQIKYYDADICLLDEKIVIEYDGSGHNLPVKFGKMTQEEFNHKELIRDKVIKREGYKQMRIISSKDLLPSDEILLQMLDITRKYFNTTTHTWINFDIDNSRMLNAENKDSNGVFFDFRKLHKVNKVA